MVRIVAYRLRGLGFDSLTRESAAQQEKSWTSIRPRLGTLVSTKSVSLSKLIPWHRLFACEPLEGMRPRLKNPKLIVRNKI